MPLTCVQFAIRYDSQILLSRPTASRVSSCLMSFVSHTDVYMYMLLTYFIVCYFTLVEVHPHFLRQFSLSLKIVLRSK